MFFTPALQRGLAAAVVFTSLSCIKAEACSPSMEYINRPLAMKLAGEGFFIGRISAVDDKHVTFAVITPGGAAKDRKTGESVTLELRENGTCGNLPLKEGETWIYNGSNISFSPSQKLEPSDLKDGAGLEEVKRNLVARLDPDYKPPKAPAKEDLPVPGIYSSRQECGAEEKATETYTLTIAEPAATLKDYSVSITHASCRGGPACSFTGAAPAYGYGEIVIPVQTAAGRNCSVIVQQLSGVDEWPPLAAGQARVRLNDYSCLSLLKDCTAANGIESPVLQRQEKAETAK
ncbi:MAG: hypothetical protein EPN97_09475 [Alphaproteobacteria bacterium]|nr:MAG: hypothetical protein EPN97_09475 [Alphaproteobacteria bacterium]